MAHCRKRRSQKPWVLLILGLTALLLVLVAWAVLREPECNGGYCPTVSTVPSTEAPSTTAPVTVPPTTDPPATEPPTTEPPTTELPTTQTPTVPMRVVTPTPIYTAPGDEAQSEQYLSIGEIVSAMEAEGDWYRLEDGGYLPAAALRPEGEYLVVIDPGHQRKGNSKKEPVGPGATEMKAKVASGTQGVATKIPEYELTLQVSLKLQALLEARGYQVVMIRTDHDVNISNAERAQMANELNADLFIRVHANGDSNSEVQGIMTLCQTPDNPYNADLYTYSQQLSRLVLDEMVSATGGKRRSIWETDTMSGINWCRVPVTIVEMGYMSNPEEDRLMATEDYQNKLAEGMAKGIDAYFTALNS